MLGGVFEIGNDSNTPLQTLIYLESQISSNKIILSILDQIRKVISIITLMKLCL